MKLVLGLIETGIDIPYSSGPRGISSLFISILSRRLVRLVTQEISA